jgi:hypothetical protein
MEVFVGCGKQNGIVIVCSEDFDMLQAAYGPAKMS